MNLCSGWAQNEVSSWGELLSDKFPDQQDHSCQFYIAGGVYNEVNGGFTCERNQEHVMLKLIRRSELDVKCCAHL